MNENTRTLAWCPLDDIVRRNFREQKPAFARPHGSFRPFVEAGGDPFRDGFSGHDLIEGGIQLLHFLRGIELTTATSNTNMAHRGTIVMRGIVRQEGKGSHTSLWGSCGPVLLQR